MDNAIILMIGLWIFCVIAVAGEYIFGDEK